MFTEHNFYFHWYSFLAPNSVITQFKIQPICYQNKMHLASSNTWKKPDTKHEIIQKYSSIMNMHDIYIVKLDRDTIGMKFYIHEYVTKRLLSEVVYSIIIFHIFGMCTAILWGRKTNKLFVYCSYCKFVTYYFVR